MVVSLMGTSSHSIDDLRVAFFTMLITFELQGTSLENGFKLTRLVPTFKWNVKPRVREKKWSAPCWPGPGISPGTGTLEKIKLHSLQ